MSAYVPVRDHFRTAMSAMRDELLANKEIIEEAQRTGVYTELCTTTTYDRYRSLLKPASLRDRLACRLRGHLPYLCEEACCAGDWYWCSRCASAKRARPPVPELAA